MTGASMRDGTLGRRSHYTNQDGAGFVYCFGANEHGQLGNGNMAPIGATDRALVTGWEVE